jgi:uncharacterized protein with PIN domain
MNIKLEKLEELPDAHHPNNIPVNFTKIGEFMEAPKVGEAFWVGNNWRTSLVTEIIDSHTFKTMNSIYRYSFV